MISPRSLTQAILTLAIRPLGRLFDMGAVEMSDEGEE